MQNVNELVKRKTGPEKKRIQVEEFKVAVA